jgi:SAM-dependent methyltransferase
MLNQVQEKISQQSQKFFTSNYAVELQIQEVENLTQNLRDRRHWRNTKLGQDDSPDQHMLGVIQQNCSYQYPVLEIGCRDGEWTKYLVAGDPLYVAEYTEEFLHNAVHQFTKQYVPRVRQYLVKDNTIHGLPENQFGFIFSYNFFNYLAFDTIKEWMRKVHTWLRPGGVIMFTYNNADFGYGAGIAESGTQSYCPMSLLVPMCESIGLEYYQHKDYVDINSYNPFSWVQFKKPGELSTVKMAQALGQIKLYSES